MKNFSLLMVFTFTVIFSAQAQTLDLGFGNGGYALVNHSADLEGPRAAQLQDDGKILAAGYTTFSGQKDFALIRLNSDGSLDPTFGTGGKVRTDLSGYDDGARGLLMQSDKKIITIGASGNGGDFDYSLTRYLPNGSLDPNFGSGGIVTTAVNLGNDEAWMGVLQPDNKIVVGGRTVGLNSNWDFGLVRYLPSGQIDPSFGVDGRVTTDVNNINNELYAMAFQPNGKILAAGYSGLPPEKDILIIRYLNDGSIDETFGDNGAVLMDLGGVNETILNIVVDHDGGILVSGSTIDASAKESFFLARYLSNGLLDQSFGLGGVVFSDFGGTLEHADSFVLLPDGKILLGGWINLGQGNTAAMFRYTSTGEIDTSFGQNGLATFLKDFRAFDLLLQTDGKVLAVGDYVANGKYDFAALRILDAEVATFQAQDEFVGVSLNPNPASDVINLQYELESAQTVSIRLLDAQGKIVYSFLQGAPQSQGKYAQRFTLPGELTPGMYFLSLQTANQLSKHKFIKM